MPDVDALPELEELLEPDQLVDSGQTRAATTTPAAPAVRPDEAPAAPLPPETRRPRPEEPRHREPEPRTAPIPRHRGTAAERRRLLRTTSRRRRLGVGVLSTVTVAAVALTVPKVLATQPPKVSLTADGKVLSVRTGAPRVGQFLRARHVRVGAEDRVVPATSVKIKSGLAISVVRAFPVAVNLDGQTMPVNTTWSRPSQLQRQLRLDPAKVAMIDPPARLARGATVILRTKHKATIQADGQLQPETTTALTVQEFLGQNGVVLSPFDQVTPAVDTRITDGMVVTVARITSDTATTQEPIAPPTQYTEDPNLPIGQQRVAQQGVPGVANVTWQVTKKDGQEVGRSPISKIPAQPPVPQIIANGTMLPNRREGRATHYASPFGSNSCATHDLTIPKGTVLRVTNLDTGVTASCVVADREEANGVVDLDDNAFAQLAPLDQGVFPARIEW